MTALPHAIVPYDRELHAPFVRESWALASRLDRRELDWWLRRPETRVRVAIVPRVPGGAELILGWAAAVPDEGFLLWVQVKKIWWGRGIGKSLAVAAMNAQPGYEAYTFPCAYWSRLAERIRRTNGKLQYDSTLARRVPRASDWISAGKGPAPKSGL